ncbi:hypothetical protein [Occallatibacter savannae]|uniref:hypothetical protein n=1 Tax=Occallatibacter savannae TaxID=1002691 RepID=UPI000D6960E5|nr:hypothetical protein [Occallatibacter savannae]
MPTFDRDKILTAIALPFLAIVAAMFALVRLILRAISRLTGWQVAWPPVLVEDEASPRTRPHSRTTAPPRRRRTRR